MSVVKSLTKDCFVSSVNRAIVSPLELFYHSLAIDKRKEPRNSWFYF
jgi:hypothetical protein